MTTPMVPRSRPQMARKQVEALARDRGVTGPVYLVGLRGYYRDSMGAPGRNDLGIYDDAIFVVSDHAFASFNANTDPSLARAGTATLLPGVWLYRLGIHGLSKPPEKRYRALVQAAPVTVQRIPVGDDAHAPLPTFTGYFGINIHRGALRSTASEGCQTIYPTQWPAFFALVETEMKRAGARTIPYLLAEGQG